MRVMQSHGPKKLSAFNRMCDCLDLKDKNKEVISLHEELGGILEESCKQWPHHDYGEGYFYQSYPPLFIRGLRNTRHRFNFYKLDHILNPGSAVLDIGCNAGFLSLMIARKAGHVDAFDNNPFLIKIAEKCRLFENIANVKFQCLTFEEFRANSKYDVVLSLANHHTFDGNMRPDFRNYMMNIRSIMKTGGCLIFESHPGEFRKPFLKEQLSGLKDIFFITETKIVPMWESAFDTNRLVCWMKAV